MPNKRFWCIKADIKNRSMERVDSNPDSQERADFNTICQACRVGDLGTVIEGVKAGVNLNQYDEWDYLPLILASLCGHKDVVMYLLAHGAICDKNTFEGERAMHAALTDEIRRILARYDMSMAIEQSNPYLAWFIRLLKTDWTKEPRENTCDILFRFAGSAGEYSYVRLHRFILAVRSEYFAGKLSSEWRELLMVDFGRILDDISGATAGSEDNYYEEFCFLINCIYFQFQARIPINKLDRQRLFELMDLLCLDESLKRVIENEMLTEISAAIKARNRNKLRMAGNDQGVAQVAAWYHQNGPYKVSIAKQVGDEIDELEYKDLLSKEEKTGLVSAPGLYADIIVYFLTFSGAVETVHFYPFHRAILLRCQHYQMAFGSMFYEGTAAEELVHLFYQIVDRVRLVRADDSMLIPTIQLNVESMALFEAFCQHVYYDKTVFPPPLALELVYLADYLALPSLTYSASESIRRAANPAFGSPVLDQQPFKTPSFLARVLRASWDLGIEKLKEYVTSLFALDMPFYGNTAEFQELVYENAMSIKNKEEADTVELVDEIRFFLEKKQGVSIDTGKYQLSLEIIEQVLQSLGIEG